MKLKYKLALLSVTFGAAGCNSNNCGDCGKQEREPKRVEEYIGGDNVHIENGCGTVVYSKNASVIYMDGNGNLYNEKGELIYTSGNGNNTASRSGGTQNQGTGQKPYQKKVVKKVEEEKVEEEKVEEKKPEEKKPEEPKTYTGISVIDVYHQNCNSY